MAGTSSENDGDYRIEGGRVCIDIRLRSVRQLFDGRDPAPFRERDLDENAVTYILESADEAPRKRDLKLVVWISDNAPMLSDATIVEAIRTHFTYLLERLRKEIRNHVRQGQVKLLLGLSVLALFLTLGRLSAVLLVDGTLRQVLQEGFAIVGWVAMWRPVEVLLYDWWPLIHHRRLLRRIIAADIQIKHHPNTSVLPGLGSV